MKQYKLSIPKLLYSPHFVLINEKDKLHINTHKLKPLTKRKISANRKGCNHHDKENEGGRIQKEGKTDKGKREQIRETRSRKTGNNN